MKKIGYILGTAAFVIGGFSSCTLDAVSYVEKTTENFPTVEDDATQALAGVFENLNQVTATPQCSFLYVAQLASDDALGGGGPNDLLMQAEDMMLNSTSDMTNQFWIDRYAGIGRANSIIFSLQSISMDETTRKQAMGEAKTLRAFYYYELASMYGLVPLKISVDEEKPTQPTAAELWGQILQDLRDAATTMPARHLTNGHIDKYTAEALLGRVWLFYTGFYGNGDDIASLTSSSYNPMQSVNLPDGSTLTKQDVITAIDDCVNNSGYSLVPDFRNLWAYTNKYTVETYNYTKGQNLKWVEDDNGINPESMFAIKFNKFADWNDSHIGYSNQYALHFGSRGAAVYPFGAGWGAGPVAPNLVDDWKAAEPKDMRRDATIQNMWDMADFAIGGGGEYIQETAYYPKKWSPIEGKKDGKEDGAISVCFENLMYVDGTWKGGAENLQLNNIHDLVLVRFADVLLMQSELKEDVSGINKVRARAGLDPIAAYSLKALQNERRWELAMEGLRWNDIRRWHIAAEALEKQTNVKIYNNGTETTNTAHAGGYAARYKATAGFCKIPESQVYLSEGGIKQNAGWEGADTNYTAW